MCSVRKCNFVVLILPIHKMLLMLCRHLLFKWCWHTYWKEERKQKQVNKHQTGIVNCTLDPDWDFLVGSWFFLMSVPVPDLEFLKYPDCDLYTHAHGSLLTWLNDSLICTAISCNVYSLNLYCLTWNFVYWLLLTHMKGSEWV